MASSYRRLLLPSPTVPVGLPLPAGDDYPPPPPPPPADHRRNVAGAVVGAALLLAVLSMVAITRHLLRRRAGSRSGTRSPTAQPPILFNTQEDFVDEEQGPQLDHPIWYIRTVGLDRSVVESIALFKYKPGEGLTEDTECSVCLGEFAEDESLRLLPKCSHAFHVPCIDTWLASHKNCPLCRAPVVRAGGAEQLSLEVPIAVSSGPNGPTVEESLHSRGISVSTSDLSLSRIGEVEADENGTEDSNSSRVEDDRGKVTALPESGKSGLRVVSDLGDHLRVVGDRIQPVRRSVSMDSPSASEIYRAVAIAMCDQSRGTSKRQAPPKAKSSSHNTDKIRRSGSGSSSLYRIVKSCSFGASLHKEPVSMKRSFSSNANVRALGQ